MLAYEEEIVMEQPAQDGIIGQTRHIIRRQVGNEVINCHPVIHGIMCLQRGRRNYAIIYAMPIAKKYYDIIMAPSEVEQKVNEIADKVEQENQERAKVLEFQKHDDQVPEQANRD